MLAMKSVTIKLLKFNHCCHTNTNSECKTYYNVKEIYLLLKIHRENFIKENYIALFHHRKVVGKS